jgi:predicted NAD/FAD-binding protein
VELWEAGSRLGGHANTLQLREGLTINDTVLGGTYAGFANTLALLHELGWQEHHSDIPVTFAGAGVPGDPSECLGGWV